MICDEILTCERVRAQVVSSDGQQSPADIHLQCTLHSTRTQVILSPTHMSTYSAAEQGESGSLEPIETRGNKLAWHVFHLSPVYLLPLRKDTLKGQYAQITSAVGMIRPQNIAQQFFLCDDTGFHIIPL